MLVLALMNENRLTSQCPADVLAIPRVHAVVVPFVVTCCASVHGPRPLASFFFFNLLPHFLAVSYGCLVMTLPPPPALLSSLTASGGE